MRLGQALHSTDIPEALLMLLRAFWKGAWAHHSTRGFEQNELHTRGSYRQRTTGPLLHGTQAWRSMRTSRKLNVMVAEVAARATCLLPKRTQKASFANHEIWIQNQNLSPATKKGT